MDIEVFKNCEYITTFYDVDNSEQGIYSFLHRFCENEGYSIGSVERGILLESARELSYGYEIELCGFDLKICD